MRTARAAAFGLALFCVSPAELDAQWLRHPTAGVPKGADGRPDLTAPAPRSADGKPDLSGIWRAAEAISDPACAPTDSCIRQEDLPVRAISIGMSSREQVARIMKGDGAFILGLLPYQPWAAALVIQRGVFQATGQGTGDRAALVDQHAKCLPPNFPRAWALPQFTKIVQNPGLVVVLHEFNASYRQMFTDGRPLPVDPQPSWNGYSSGTWEGDTLVVRTTGFRDDLWLDITGSPLTSAATVTERFRRVNYGRLDIEVTVDDPKAYTKPWTVRMDQAIVLDTELLEGICLENEKSVQRMIGK